MASKKKPQEPRNLRIASDSLTNVNKNNPWVNRYLQGNSLNIPDPYNPGSGKTSSHGLSYHPLTDSTAMIYPEIIQQGDSLVKMNNDQAREYAIKNKTGITTDLELAKYYSENGLIQHQQGGKLMAKKTGKLPANSKLKDGVIYNTQGDTIRHYVPTEDRFINEPVSGYRPSKLSGVLEQSRNRNIKGGLVEPLPVNIPMRQEYGLSKQKPVDSMSPYLPEYGFGSFLANFAPKIASAIPVIGQIAGPVLQAGMSIFNGIKANKDAQEQAGADQLMLDEQAAAQKEQQRVTDLNTRRSNIIDTKQVNYGATFEDGGQIGMGFMNQQPQITEYENGNTHQQGVGGIPVDAKGNPATTSRGSAVGLTEKGEVTWNGYVFSDKLKNE